MKASEVHQLSDQEITETHEKLRKQLYELRSKSVTQKLENPAQLGEIRKDIARLQTESKARSTKVVKA